ncbi:MAG: ATP-binding protein [Pseudomonadota bacterium]
MTTVQDKTSTVMLIGPSPSDEFGAQLHAALVAAGFGVLSQEGGVDVEEASLPTSGFDCAVWYIPGGICGTSTARHAAIAQRVTPAPLLMIAPGIDAAETGLLSAGVEDCLDSKVIPIAAILRVLRRSIERASQRVHVKTAEQQYQNLFDHMPIAALRVDANGSIIAGNRAFLAFMGADSVADIGDDHLNGLLAGLGQLQRNAADEPPAYSDNHIIDTVAHAQRHVMVFARPGAGNDVPAMDVYLTDITEKELQTRRVLAAENRLRDLYNNVPVMMFSLDTSLRVRDANRTLVNRVGVAADALNGLPLQSLLHPDNADDLLVSSNARILAGGSERELPMIIIGSDGTRMECLYSASAHRDDAGSVVGTHAMLVDVTERNNAQRERDELQEQLQLTQKLESIGELAAGIAHEINTPAQYVSDNLAFLSESFGDLGPVLHALPDTLDALGSEKTAALAKQLDEADLDYLLEEIPEALDQGKHGIQKIREIVLALKDFSHPGSGEMEMADLNRILESTVTVARNEWKYIADMEFDLAPDLPAVECFPSAIAQVVLNIVVNAAHAIADERNDSASDMGLIRITSAMPDDKSVVFTIGDNGPGIPDDIKRKIFDPFFTTKEVGRGTGQGLAISRTVIAEQHGGQIHVDSAPGEGTTFRIELPIGSGRQRGLKEEAA